MMKCLASLVLFGALLATGAPTVSTVSPSSGEVGTPITITGTNLSRDCEVIIGGEPTKVKAATATEIQVSAPPNTPGKKDVVVIRLAYPKAVAKEAFEYR